MQTRFFSAAADFVKEAWASLLRRIRRQPKAICEAQSTVADASVSPQTTSAAVKRRPQDRSKGRTLTEILHGLDETWKNLAREHDTCWDLMPVLRSELAGLKRIGPTLITENWLPEDAPPIAEFKTNDCDLPYQIFLAVNDGDTSKKDKCAPDFFFATKLKKTPWTVTKQPGHAYSVGMGWRSPKGKTYWGHVYAYIRNRKIYPASWLCSLPVAVGSGSYTRRLWTTSSWNHHAEMAAFAVEQTFSYALQAWERRNESWNVAVNKDGRRATFLIDKTLTAYAFKDREITALAADGKRKRIIHFVRAHTQDRGDKIVEIPAHIRGLREFDWNGYHCYVTSPQHHAFLDSQLSMESEHILGDEDDPCPEGLLTPVQFANILVASEEGEQRVLKRGGSVPAPRLTGHGIDATSRLH